MRSEKVIFPNPQGHRLAGRLDLPDAGAPRAWALFAHCFTCDKSFKAPYHLGRALAREGFGMLRFDFPGLGESEGEVADTTLSSNVDDVVAAAEFLAGTGRAPALLIGHSLGGAAAVRAAPRIPSVRAVATLAAPFDPSELPGLLSGAREAAEQSGAAAVDLGGRTVRLGSGFFRDLEGPDLGQGLSALGLPLLILHSPEDDVVAFGNAERLLAAASHPKSLVSLEGADHLLSRPEDAAYAGSMIAAWFERYAGERPPVAKAAAAVEKGVRVLAGAHGYRTEITAGGHFLVADEPVSDGGTATGPSPYELLLSALGACTAMTLRMYADRKGWPLEAIEVALDLDEIHAEECARCETRVGTIDRIRREIHLSGDLSDEQRTRLRQIADRCPVHQTLTSEILIETSVGSRNAQTPAP